MIRRMLALLTVALIATFSPARAAEPPAAGPMGGLGFHVGGSPFSALLSNLVAEVPQSSPFVGGRHWFNGSAGFDLGAGYNYFQRKEGASKKTYTGFALDAGVPLSLKRWNNVNFILRPGAQFGSLEEKDESAPPAVTTTWTMAGASLDLEVEWMVAEKVSVSAAHGIGWHQMKDDFTPESKYTAFGTSGSDFTQLGFHVYLW